MTESAAEAEPQRLALFVGEWLPYSETFVHDQLQHQRRFTAHVFALKRAASAAAFSYPRVWCLRSPERLSYLWLGRAPSLRRALASSEPRLAHAHFGLNGVRALPFVRRIGCPLVVSFHGHDVPGLALDNRFTLRYGRYVRQARALFEYASMLVCASADLANVLVEQHGAPPDKVRVHHLGVDLARFPAQQRDERAGFRVLMIGRLVEKKGMADGIAAFAQLARERPDASLRIAGTGPLRPLLEQVARTQRVERSVQFLGAVPRERIARELGAADVLLAPSVVARDGDRESGVLAVKEAGAAALPVVATRHGGIPEIVKCGVTGFLTAEHDARALGEYLIALSRDVALRQRLGAAARTKVEQEFDTVRQNQRLETLLWAALG